MALDEGRHTAVATADITDLLRKAAAELHAGRPVAAERLLGRALKADPGHALAHHMAGSLHLAAGRLRKAIPHLRKAVAGGGGADALANLGIALAAAGEGEEAERALREAAEAQPGNAQVAFNLGVLLAGGGREEAEPWLRRAVELAPDYVRAWSELGALLLAAGRVDEAADALDRALDLEPGDRGVRADRALADRLRGRHAEAVAGYAACRPLDDLPADVALGYGFCLQETGEVEAALDVYRDLLRRDRGTYGSVLKNLTSASKGMLALHPSVLRRRLGLS